MRNRYVESVDVETGEVLPGCLIYIPRRPRHLERFFMGFQDAFASLAKDDELTLEPKNVLLYLFGQLSFENYLHVSQKDIADALGIHKANVSKAMKLLASKGIILDGPKVGRMKTYRLSPDLGWKGRVASMEQYRRDQLRVIDGGKSD
jgi:biotin operon repressor